MPYFSITVFERDIAISGVLLLLVIVSAIQASSKHQGNDGPWPPNLARYWNLAGFSLMLLGFLWRILFRDR
jgi:hypothetical protein